MSWPRVIGVVGGLGPHAHVEFERLLLAAVAASSDQEYPEWVLSSIPSTPDRTLALLEGGDSPVPGLVRSLKRLAGSADFAVIACMTAHAFLDEVRPLVRLPILDLVELALAEAASRYGDSARIGLLATSGSLASGLYPRAAARVAPGLEIVSLLDLPEGAQLQEELMMRAVYGPLVDGRRLAGGIKSGGERDPLTGLPHRDILAQAVGCLAAAGVAAVVTGCTEVPLALGREAVEGIPLLDPMDLGAQVAVAIARGERPLP